MSMPVEWGESMGFPEQLKMARLRMGYTQQLVADRMGVSKSTYCGYETGKRQPAVEKIKQLAHILQTSGDRLLETGFHTDADHKCDDILSVFQSLKPAFQDCALEQMKKLAELQGKG